jgi:glycosyltransferase involved in cell wall biosynthesis
VNDTITVLAFSYNEQKRIRYFLESVKGFAPIVLIDNHSTDDTVAIARKYGLKVVTHRNAGYAEHPDTVQFALTQVATPWVYWGRVDEIPPAPLLQRLDEIARLDEGDVVLVARLNLLFGRPVKTWGTDHQLVFFKPSALNPARSALFEHGSVRAGSRVLRLAAEPALALWHFSSYDVAAYTNTNNRYSTIAAREIMARRGRPVSYSTSAEKTKRLLKSLVGRLQNMPSLALVRLFVTPPLRFGWHYFWRGGFRSGRAGFVTSYLMMMEQMLIELKLDEKDRGISLEAIEGEYDQLKVRLIAGEVPGFGPRQ